MRTFITALMFVTSFASKLWAAEVLCTGMVDGRDISAKAAIAPFGSASFNLGNGLTAKLTQQSLCATGCQTTRRLSIELDQESTSSSLTFDGNDVGASKVSFPSIETKMGGKAVALSCELSVNQTDMIRIYENATGIFPAPIMGQWNSSVLELVESGLAKCGGANVSDLDLRVSVSGNKTPGAATVVVSGDARCN